MTYPIHFENIQLNQTKQVSISQVDQKIGDRYWNYTHFHKMHEIIKYTNVVDGIIVINGEEYTLKPNTLVYVPSLSVHDLQFPVESRRTWSLIQFEPDLLNSLHFDAYKSFFSAPLVIQLDDEMNERYEYLFQWYAQEFESPQGQLGRRILALIIELLLGLLKNAPQYTAQPTVNAKGIMQFTPLLVHLEQNNLFNLSLDAASKMCGLSKFHFSRLFKSYFNLNYNEYLLKRKIGMAMTQLSNPDLSITEISYSCGFNDTAYFCKKFKKESGKTPKEFRKLII